MVGENTWQGAAASSTLVACSAPTVVGLSLAAVGLDLKRENHDQLAGAERCFSCGVLSLYFKAAIALRWRRMTPMARAAIMDKKSASMTMAGMDAWWVGGLADDVEVGAAVTVFCVGGIAGSQGDELQGCGPRDDAVREADGKEWVVFARVTCRFAGMYNE
jgi:hypothetical protein